MPPLPRLCVSLADPHLLATDDGQPFFLLGDTAWELFHRLTRAESETYFAGRAAQGFTLVCAVALAEFDGLQTPNAEGHLPLHNLDPRRPNEAYFALVDAQITQAQAHGLYVGLLPTWGDKLTAPWGDGPRLFHPNDPDTARAYGLWLGQRYRNTTNLLWILGGDRPPRLEGISPTWHWPWDAGFTPETDWIPLWRAMAEGIADGTNGQALFAYHPQGGPLSTSVYLHHEDWLAINMMQSGHGGGKDVPVWEWVERDYHRLPPRPTLDAEPNYEDHPVNPWPVWNPENGYFSDYDVRKQCYRSVFAGGCGVIYGHHAVWQFWDRHREPINHPTVYWPDALNRPGAAQVGHLRRLMETYLPTTRLPAPDMVVAGAGAGGTRTGAIRDPAGRCALVYIPTGGQTVTLSLTTLQGPRLTAAWFDPRTGTLAPPFAACGTDTPLPVTTPAADGAGGDRVLVLTAG